nr:MAG TPA: hypothetical protein [Caudoviricetes sp.]
MLYISVSYLSLLFAIADDCGNLLLSFIIYCLAIL